MNLYDRIFGDKDKTANAMTVSGHEYNLNVSAWDADDSTIWGAFPRELADDDSSLYQRYEDAYFSSPLATLLVDHVNSMLNHYEFVPGPEGSDEDVQKVEEHFRLTDAEQKLSMITLQAIILGTGVSQLVKTGESVDDEEGMQVLDTKNLNFRAELQEDGTYEETIEQQGQPLDPEKILMIRLKRYPGRVSGISMMTSTLFSLEALNELIEDIPAAIKQLAYIQRVAKINLEGLDSREEKETALENLNEKFRRFNSAKSTILTIDKEHDVGYMGQVGGQGSAMQRLVPMRDLIEPLVSWTMLNFNMGLGHILQTGANKAILEKQEERIKIVTQQMQGLWAKQVEQQYIDAIVGENRVRIRHLQGADDIRAEKTMAMQEVQNLLISPEEYRERFNLKGPPPQQEVENVESENVTNNDTQEENQTGESQEERGGESE